MIDSIGSYGSMVLTSKIIFLSTLLLQYNYTSAAFIQKQRWPSEAVKVHLIGQMYHWQEGLNSSKLTASKQFFVILKCAQIDIKINYNYTAKPHSSM